jgi:single-stranded DNA-binding protein
MLRFNLIGRLAADPELSTYGPDQTPMARLRVASNQPGAENADFFDVTVFGDKGIAAISDAHKGDRVELRGNARQGVWTADDGSRRERVNLAARWVQVTPRRQSTAADTAAHTNQAAASASASR